MSRFTSIVRQVSPPILTSIAEQLQRRWNRSGVTFTGDYDNWTRASNDATGYDDETILAKVLEAAIAVRDGKAIFERDSVLFHREEFAWPTLACLCDVAARNQGKLRVVDFGGSLGSFFFQHRKFLDRYDTVWTVVEQPHFVAAGRRELASNRLHFEESIYNLEYDNDNAVLFLSGVLHYLPDPHQFVARVLMNRWDAVIIDRTPLLAHYQVDRITVQRVPPSIYAAEYPAWFFSQVRFLALFEEHFELKSHWPSLDVYFLDGRPIQTRGLYFSARSSDLTHSIEPT